MLPPNTPTPQRASGDAALVARRRQKARGQSMVEFAVMLPVLALILVLAADFGRAFTAYIAITGAAREGAAYGMQSTQKAAEAGTIQTVALAEISDSGEIFGDPVTVSSQVLTEPVATGGYNYVQVTANYSFAPLFPLSGLWDDLPETIPMSRTVRMRVVN